MDQGTEDAFYRAGQLLPESLVRAARASGLPWHCSEGEGASFPPPQPGNQLCVRMQPGYDHSYWFVASFIRDHLRFHFGPGGL